MVLSPSCANSTGGEKVEPSVSARRSTVKYSPFWTVYCFPPSLITANIVCFGRSSTGKTARPVGRSADCIRAWGSLAHEARDSGRSGRYGLLASPGPGGSRQLQGGARPVKVSVAVFSAVLALVLPGPASAAPSAPVLQTDAPVTSDSPHVYWAAVPGADEYVVTRLAGCQSGTPLDAYSTEKTWFDDVFIDLRRPARLGYVAQAHDATGWSASSSCVAVTYDPAPPQLFLE